MKNMKYKVLAADDEFWSRENIRKLIPWLSLIHISEPTRP